MKKVIIGIIGLIVLLWLIFFIKDIARYRFGYFVEGPELKYEHRDADVLKLENGNVLILGQNAHSCPTPEACKDNIMPVVEIPSEIYNAKTNKIEELRLPNNIRYQAKGILLKNNRLLLTYAYDPSDKSYPKVKRVGETIKDIKPPYLYYSMAVINLDNMKVEKIVKRKLNNTNILNSILNEVQDNNQDVSDILLANSKSKISWYKKIAINNKLLFFEEDTSHDYSIYKYDNLLMTSKLIKARMCKPSIFNKINDQEILVICSDLNYGKPADYPINIYNISTKEVKTISHMPRQRCGYNGTSMNNRYFLLAGGHNCSHPLTRYYKNSLILDLDKNKIYSGAKLPYNIDEPSMVSLNNDNVLILDNKLNAYAKKTLIFKKRKGNMTTSLK